MKKTNQDSVIPELASVLKSHYDCITKIDALRFLRKLYPNKQIKVFVKAYNSALRIRVMLSNNTRPCNVQLFCKAKSVLFIYPKGGLSLK